MRVKVKQVCGLFCFQNIFVKYIHVKMLVLVFRSCLLVEAKVCQWIVSPQVNKTEMSFLLVFQVYKGSQTSSVKNQFHVAFVAFFCKNATQTSISNVQFTTRSGGLFLCVCVFVCECVFWWVCVFV